MSANVRVVPAESSRPQAVVSSTAFSDNVSLGYLRALITLLVVAHHAVLAYHPFAPAPPTSLVAEPRIGQAFPVVDSQRS